jgi:nicotinate-nucleotide adenylyltransferase
MKRIAFYGGSFDPLHNGHLMIAKALTDQFRLDSFVFVPAFHAPHKKDKNPTSPFHRFSMIAISTADFINIKVSNIELESPEKPYSFETLTKLKAELPNDRIFFIIGADSWQEIATWREWETVLTLVNIIVVTRPGYEIGFEHVTDEIRTRIVDLRASSPKSGVSGEVGHDRLGTLDLGLETKIFLSDAVQANISATEIRKKIHSKADDWREFLPTEVANYIEKYDLYL